MFFTKNEKTGHLTFLLKVLMESKTFLSLISLWFLHTYEADAFLCLNRRAIIIPKEKKQYLWQRIWITSTKEEHKVSSGIGKLLTINKTSSDFYAFMHIFISQGEFTDCKNEHVLWLMSVCKCALFRQMFWRGVHAYMKISIR